MPDEVKNILIIAVKINRKINPLILLKTILYGTCEIAIIIIKSANIQKKVVYDTIKNTDIIYSKVTNILILASILWTKDLTG